MNSFRIERPHYFTGEALLTDDFVCEQTYQMGMLATHNTSLYTYGIATGLVVSEPESNNSVQQVQVSPGVAIDRLGRQIILLQATVLPLQDIQPSTTYFITINYAEVFADLSDETGTPGYKRIVQQPQLKYLRNLDEPGINILLAAVSFDANSSISNLTYESQNKQRRYVSASVGAVQFITAGSGVDVNADVAAASVLSDSGYAKILAQSEGSGKLAAYYLEFDAPRSQFMGHLSSRGNFGVGVDHPVANLQIDAVTFKGTGLFSTNGVTVTFDVGPSPFFQVGDILISDQSVGNGPQQTRTITSIVTDGSVVKVNSPFSPNLTNTTYTYIRGTLARFAVNSSASSLFLVNYDGSVGLGVAAAPNSQKPGPNALSITADRKVGIALNGGSPSATLDVNGNINTTGITASGKVVAQSFEGNGSGLKNLNIISDWVKETPGSNASNLYYNAGNVGILDSNPQASLSVGGGVAQVGSGVISLVSGVTVTGYNTAFLDQVKPGDTLAIGTLSEQRSTIVSQPGSDTVLQIQPQFSIPVIGSKFSVLSAATGEVADGNGTITSDGTTINGTGTAFTQFNAGDTLIIPRFTASAEIVQTCDVASVTSDTSLTLKAAFSGTVTDVSWQYSVNNSTPVAGTGTISVIVDPVKNPGSLIVTGTGTNFSTAFPNGTGQIIASPVVSSKPQAWVVASVKDQCNLTLVPGPNGATPLFTATTSAYMVTNGMLAKFQTNSDNGVLDQETELSLPPAMLIVNNSDPDYPNTVAINIDIDDIDRQFALQVDGAVSFSGGGTFSDLTVDTLLAKQSITIDNPAPNGNLLTVGGPVSSNTLLAVSGTQVTVGPLLSVQGTLNATGNIGSNTQVQAPAVVGSTSVQTPTATSNALNVTGLSIDAAGTVSLLGSRQTWSLSASNTAVNSILAATDGFVYGVISQTQMDGVYWGVITASSHTGSSNGPVVCTMAAATTTVTYTTPDGKGSTTSYVAVPGSFTMPVRKGEYWNVAFQSGIRGFSSPNAAIYWIPLGNGSASPYTAPAASTAPVTATSVSSASAITADSVVESSAAPATRSLSSDAATSSLAANPSVDDLNKLAAQLSAIPNDEISGTSASAANAPTLAAEAATSASTSASTAAPASANAAAPASVVAPDSQAVAEPARASLAKRVSVAESGAATEAAAAPAVVAAPASSPAAATSTEAPASVAVPVSADAATSATTSVASAASAPASADSSAAAAPTAAPDAGNASTAPPAASPTLAQFHQSLQNMVVATPGSNGGLATSVQDTINQRVSNLTRVLDSVTHTSASDAERAQFVQELQKIVCSTTPTGDVVAKPLDQQSVQDLINTTSKITGHQFTPEQEAMLEAGVKALVQINESDANRNNLSLIKKNVDMFIDNLQQSLDMQFSTEDRRSLLRGLVTLVGDGRTRPEVAMTPPITPPAGDAASVAAPSGTTASPAGTVAAPAGAVETPAGATATSAGATPAGATVTSAGATVTSAGATVTSAGATVTPAASVVTPADTTPPPTDTPTAPTDTATQPVPGTDGSNSGGNG